MKKHLANFRLTSIEFQLTIDLQQVPALNMINRDEKGIRCESGTIPVAVNSITIFGTSLPLFQVFGTGRLPKTE